MIGGIQNIGRIPSCGSGSSSRSGCLAVYRIGCAVVTPGINSQRHHRLLRADGRERSSACSTLSRAVPWSSSRSFALGIMPYISATIIFQLLTVVIPQLEALKKEGEQGQKKINQWSRYATIVLACSRAS